MPIAWNITDAEVAKVKAFVASRMNDGLVKHRIKFNLTNRPTCIDRADVWHNQIYCLMSTQQKSGPEAFVTKFVNLEPFPLSLEKCRASSDVRELVVSELTNFGGIRRAPTIASEAKTNIEWFHDQWWPEVDEVLRSLIGVDDPRAERLAAHFIDNAFKGFGPKQARNLLQMLGLTRYEIPLDSRVAKWFNAFGFGVSIDAAELPCIGPYERLSDKVIELCRRAEIYPCVLDAAAFASFDGDGWNSVDGIIG